jgi:hypothetical protein
MAIVLRTFAFDKTLYKTYLKTHEYFQIVSIHRLALKGNVGRFSSKWVSQLSKIYTFMNTQSLAKIIH